MVETQCLSNIISHRAEEVEISFSESQKTRLFLLTTWTPSNLGTWGQRAAAVHSLGTELRHTSLPMAATLPCKTSPPASPHCTKAETWPKGNKSTGWQATKQSHSVQNEWEEAIVWVDGQWTEKSPQQRVVAAALALCIHALDTRDWTVSKARWPLAAEKRGRGGRGIDTFWEKLMADCTTWREKGAQRGQVTDLRPHSCAPARIWAQA